MALELSKFPRLDFRTLMSFAYFQPKEGPSVVHYALTSICYICHLLLIDCWKHSLCRSCVLGLYIAYLLVGSTPIVSPPLTLTLESMFDYSLPLYLKLGFMNNSSNSLHYLHNILKIWCPHTHTLGHCPRVLPLYHLSIIAHLTLGPLSYELGLLPIEFC